MDGDLSIPRGAGLINPNPVVHAKPTPTSATVFLPKDYNNSKHGYRIDALEIFDMIRTIKDPEHPHTLEELNVITEDDVQVIYLDDDDDGDDIQVDEPSINSNSNSNIDNSNSNEIDEKQNNNNKVKNNIRNYRPLTKLQKAQLSRLLGSSSSPTSTSVGLIRIGFTPTVEHCSLATHIGLCLRQKLMNELPNANDFKVDIYVYENMHKLANDITKQINDKERVAAAMENQQLRALIDECIKEPDYS